MTRFETRAGQNDVSSHFQFADGACRPAHDQPRACSSQHPAVGAAPSSGRFLRHEESLFCDRLCPTVASTVDCGDRRIDRALGQPFELQVPAPVPAAHTQRSPLLSPAFVRGEALNSPFIGRVAILHRPPSTIFALQLSLHYSSVGSQAQDTFDADASVAISHPFRKDDCQSIG